MFCWLKRCFYKWANTEMAIRSFPLNPDLELVESPEGWPLGPRCPERSLACVIDRARQTLSGQPRAPCCFAWRWLEFMPFQLRLNACFCLVGKYHLHYLASPICVLGKYLSTSQICSPQPALVSRTEFKKKRIHIHTFNFNLP